MEALKIRRRLEKAERRVEKLRAKLATCVMNLSPEQLTEYMRETAQPDYKRAQLLMHKLYKQ